MRKHLLVMLFSFAALTGADDELDAGYTPVFTTAFGSASVPLKGNDRVSGVLPDGWREDSAWAKTWVNYTVVSERGENSLRISVTNIVDGKCQFTHDIPQKNGIWRLRVRARSADLLTLTVGVRETGPKYKFLALARFSLTREFREHLFECTLPAHTQPTALYALIEDRGEIDIASFVLEESDEASMDKRFRLRYPYAENGNLLRTTRLPLGLQSGWMLDRNRSDGDDIVIAADTSEKGPSGYPPLTLENPGATSQLYSEPFFVPLSGTHIASMYVNGRGKGSLAVLGEGKTLATKTFDLGDVPSDVFTFSGASAAVTNISLPDNSRGYRISIPKAGANPWDVRLDAVSRYDIALGDTVLIVFNARALSADSSGADNNYIKIEQSSAPYRSVLSQKFRPETEWKRFVFAGSAPIPYEAGKCRVTFQLGANRQEVEIANIRCMDLRRTMVPDEAIRAANASAPLNGTDMLNDAETRTGAWTRVAVPFKPIPNSRGHALMLSWSGSLRIDAMQVERGETPRPYAPQSTAEVSLASPQYNNIFFDGPPTADYCVTGAPAGSFLHARTINVYREESGLSRVALSGKTMQNGNISIPPGRNVYGSQRIETWVADAGGKRISPFAEIVLHRMRTPRYWKADAPRSPFGIHTIATTRHILMAKAMGFNWTRLHDAGLNYIGWYHLEPQKGTWMFSDADIQRYRTHSMKVMGEYSTAPRWASYGRDIKPQSEYFDRFYQPRDLNDYANYVRVVSERYRGIIDTYEVWNEPWIHAWWGVGFDTAKGERDGYITSKNAQADYVKLMAAAYAAAKKVDPSITVVGVNTTANNTEDPASTQRRFNGPVWSRGVSDAGGLAYCDAVSYHHYITTVNGFPSDGVEKGGAESLDVFRTDGRHQKPVIMSEGSSIMSSIGGGLYKHTLPVEDNEDCMRTANMLIRYMTSLLVNDVQRMFLYSMHCFNHFYRGNAYRFLVNEDGTMHPAGVAANTFTWLIEDMRFVKTVTLARGVYAYLFDGDGRSAAVISTWTSEREEYIPPARDDIRCYDIFGNTWRQGVRIGPAVMYVSAKGNASALETMLTK